MIIQPSLYVLILDSYFCEMQAAEECAIGVIEVKGQCPMVFANPTAVMGSIAVVKKKLWTP